MAFLDRMRAFNRRVVRAVTAFLLVVGLFLVYWLGIALTRALAAVLSRRRLRLPPPGRPSYWLPAEGYDQTLEDSVSQS